MREEGTVVLRGERERERETNGGADKDEDFREQFDSKKRWERAVEADKRKEIN